MEDIISKSIKKEIMRAIITLVILGAVTLGYAQENSKISTMDFVQIIDENKEEALFYYASNWKFLRDKALEKNYIHSYQLLETPFSEDEPFQLILITTYSNKQEYDLGEERFDKLIAEKGPLCLMNHKKPREFRKVLFNKMAKHLH